MRRLSVLLVLLALVAWVASAALAEPVQITVEGQGDYFVTGESYPVAIQVAGYNSRDGHYYLTFTLSTTKTVEAGQTASFDYFIEIFDGNGVLLGNSGTLGTPEQVSGSLGSNEATVTNQMITLSALPAAYRVVITVKSVAIS